MTDSTKPTAHERLAWTVANGEHHGAATLVVDLADLRAVINANRRLTEQRDALYEIALEAECYRYAVLHNERQNRVIEYRRLIRALMRHSRAMADVGSERYEQQEPPP